jgi:hypothetical protein
LSLFESLLLITAPPPPGEEFWDVAIPPIAPPISGAGGESIAIGFSPSELNFRNPPGKQCSKSILKL